MIIKTLLVTVVLVAFVMLGLGIKMLFKKDAKFEMRSCSFINEEEGSEGSKSLPKIKYKKLNESELKENKSSN